jgi:hypothetical protein
MNLDFADVSNFFKSNKTFMASTFALEQEYSHAALTEVIQTSIKNSYSDVNIKTNNIKLLMNLKISTKVPSSVTNDIRNIFKEITKDHALSLVYGVDYVNIEGLKASYLISANDQEQSIEMPLPTSNLEEYTFDNENSESFNNNDFINVDEYKTTPQKNNTGGVKHESIKFGTEEIILDEKNFSSGDASKLMTKAINSVIGNQTKKYSKKYN